MKHWMISYKHKKGNYVTICLTVQNDIVTEAPPIAKWTIGRNWDFILDYYKKYSEFIVEELK